MELYKLLDEGHPIASDLEALLLHFDNNWDQPAGIIGFDVEPAGAVEGIILASIMRLRRPVLIL